MVPSLKHTPRGAASAPACGSLGSATASGPQEASPQQLLLLSPRRCQTLVSSPQLLPLLLRRRESGWARPGGAGPSWRGRERHACAGRCAPAEPLRASLSCPGCGPRSLRPPCPAAASRSGPVWTGPCRPRVTGLCGSHGARAAGGPSRVGGTAPRGAFVARAAAPG